MGDPNNRPPIAPKWAREATRIAAAGVTVDEARAMGDERPREKSRNASSVSLRLSDATQGGA